MNTIWISSAALNSATEAEAPSGPPADGLHPSGRPLTNSEYLEKYFTKIDLDEMESQFKKDSWVWIAGLKGAKELNGTLGQIVKFNEEKQRPLHG